MLALSSLLSPAIFSPLLYTTTMSVVFYFGANCNVCWQYLLFVFTSPHLLPIYNYISRISFLSFTRKDFISPKDSLHPRRVHVLSFILSLYLGHTFLFLYLSQCPNISECIPVTCLSFLPAVNLKLREIIFKSKHSSHTEDDLWILVWLNVSLNTISYHINSCDSTWVFCWAYFLHYFIVSLKNLRLIQGALESLKVPRSTSSDNHWMI